MINSCQGNTFVHICDLKVNLIKVDEIRRRFSYRAQSYYIFHGARAPAHMDVLRCETNAANFTNSYFLHFYSLKGLVTMFKNKPSSFYIFWSLGEFHILYFTYIFIT